MKKIYFNSTVVFFGIMFYSITYAQLVVEINEKTEKIPLGKYLSLFEDKKNIFTIKEVSSEKFQEKFIENHKNIPNFKYTKSKIWVKFNLFYNSTIEFQKKFLLELAYPILDEVNLFIPDSKGGFIETKTGDTLSISTREIKCKNFIFPIKIQSGKSLKCFMSIKSDSQTQIPLTLWDIIYYDIL